MDEMNILTFVLSFLSYLERTSAPHFMRGAIIAYLIWVAALKWHWRINPVVCSLVGMLLISVGWEFYDLARGPASDGFSWPDILFDLLGAIWVQVVYLTYRKYGP